MPLSFFECIKLQPILHDKENQPFQVEVRA